jgi:hypothetical protein
MENCTSSFRNYFSLLFHAQFSIAMKFLRPQSLQRLLYVIWLIWICSFSLPAHVSPAFRHPEQIETHFGLEAFTESFFCFVCLYYGQLWIGNLFMIIAPFMLPRAFGGRGRVYAAFLAMFAVLPALLPLGWVEPVVHIAIGFYVWWISMLLMAALFGVVLLPRKRVSTHPRNLRPIDLLKQPVKGSQSNFH